ncbi:MAG: hypothetical protein AAB728_04360 [Patescibacteria group bacterium]
MEFNYTQRESDVGVLYVPTLPITINGFAIGHALVDTGADVTILPMEVNDLLALPLDTDHSIDMFSAGGGKFRAIPSVEKVQYTLDHSGFRPISWRGMVFFAPRQPMILLGQFECLSQLTITLDAPCRKMIVEGGS